MAYKLVFLLSTTLSSSKGPLAWKDREAPAKLADTFPARPCSYLIPDHVFCHFHATAGVGAAQDKLVISVLSLAAGVREGQACDAAPQSLGRGWSGGAPSGSMGPSGACPSHPSTKN